jgi:hypothetical protein
LVGFPLTKRDWPKYRDSLAENKYKLISSSGYSNIDSAVILL